MYILSTSELSNSILSMSRNYVVLVRSVHWSDV